MTDSRNGDVVMKDGRFFLAEFDRFAKRIEWVPLLPIGASQSSPPDGAVLVCRVVDGKPLPVIDIGSGDLLSIRTVAEGTR